MRSTLGIVVIITTAVVLDADAARETEMSHGAVKQR